MFIHRCTTAWCRSSALAGWSRGACTSTAPRPPTTTPSSTRTASTMPTCAYSTFIYFQIMNMITRYMYLLDVQEQTLHTNEGWSHRFYFYLEKTLTNNITPTCLFLLQVECVRRKLFPGNFLFFHSSLVWSVCSWKLRRYLVHYLRILADTDKEVTFHYRPWMDLDRGVMNLLICQP